MYVCIYIYISLSLSLFLSLSLSLFVLLSSSASPGALCLSLLGGLVLERGVDPPGGSKSRGSLEEQPSFPPFCIWQARLILWVVRNLVFRL